MNAKPLRLLLSCTLISWSAMAADITQLVAGMAGYESGASLEPLSRIEILVRQSVGKSGLRNDLEVELTKLITGNATYEAKRFACQQLAVVGSDRSLPAVGELLRHGETVGIACLALGTRPSAKAGAVLLEALSSLRGAARTQVVDTLGDRRDTPSVKRLADLARDPDLTTAEAAITALGKIADQPAIEAIARLRKEANPVLTRAVLDASLRVAESLAAAGNRKAVAALYEELGQPSQPLFVRRAAEAALRGIHQNGSNR
ncbi:MAG: HEAT repeat domain-containing protein [Limisphaerales bacterium]